MKLLSHCSLKQQVDLAGDMWLILVVYGNISYNIKGKSWTLSQMFSELGLISAIFFLLTLDKSVKLASGLNS